MLPVELVRNDTLLVGLQSIDSLKAVLGGQEAGLPRTIVSPPVCAEPDNNGQKTKEKIHDLVAEECLGVNAAKAVDNRGAEQSAKPVAAVPTCDTERLLGTPVECDGNDREKRDNSSLEGSEEEARREETSIVPRSTKTSSDRDTPAGNDNGKDLAESCLDENPGSERLDTELSVVTDVTDVGVVVALEFRVCLESIDSRQANNSFICRLQEINHAKK